MDIIKSIERLRQAYNGTYAPGADNLKCLPAVCPNGGGGQDNRRGCGIGRGSQGVP